MFLGFQRRENVMNGDTYHKNRTAPVELRTIGMLPDILDPVSVPAGECSPKGFDTTLDCFSMTLERGFTPAYDTVRGFDTNEYPSGRNTESLVISRMCVYL